MTLKKYGVLKGTVVGHCATPMMTTGRWLGSELLQGRHDEDEAAGFRLRDATEC